MEIILKANKINKKFCIGESEIRVLDNFDFECNSGETVGLFGYSGSGKTTLLHCLSLIDTFESGDLFFKKRKISNLSDSEKTDLIRKEFGFIFQFHYLLDDFNVFDNIFLQAKIAGQSDKEAKKNTDILIERIRLDHRIKSFPNMLSGGEKQRVAVARALVKKPKILFADEPTGSLDIKLGNEIFNLILDLTKSYEGTLIMSTHNTGFRGKFDKTYDMNRDFE